MYTLFLLYVSIRIDIMKVRYIEITLIDIKIDLRTIDDIGCDFYNKCVLSIAFSQIIEWNKIISWMILFDIWVLLRFFI